MAIFKNLEDQFNARVKDLYSPTFHPYKESSELHPIVVVYPDDPNLDVGDASQGSRMVPVGRVLTDLERTRKWMSSPRGLESLIRQQLLQTGNAISETRTLNPLFLLENTAPYTHTKRQLFDQTDIIIDSAERSPASTPDVGAAGRMQLQTGGDATSRVLGSQSGRDSLVGWISSTQLVQTLSSVFNFTEGTYAINDRPEISVPTDLGTKLYSVLLYSGRNSIVNAALDGLITALGVVGVGASYVGLPNIFSDITNRPVGVAQASGIADVMPYFIGGINERNIDPNLGPVTYLKTERTKEARIIEAIPIKIDTSRVLTTIFSNLLGIDLGPIQGRLTSVLVPIRTGAEVAVGTALDDPRDDDLFTKPRRSLKTRFLAAKTFDTTETGLTKRAQERIDDHRKKTDSARQTYQDEYKRFREQMPTLAARGIYGGLAMTQERMERISQAKTYAEVQSAILETYDRAEDGTLVPQYYRDALNEIIEIRGDGTEDVFIPLTLAGAGVDLDGVPTMPEDFITVQFTDVVNNRIIPFRAMLEGINESISTEFEDRKYIGRIERNIVYQGAKRTLSFTLHVNAWSARELDGVWTKVNYMTGLTFPSQYTNDGFMSPPLVKLTIGDFYKDQPGYISSLTNTIEDGTPWEIAPEQQVPHRVQMAITFEVIEKEAMHARSQFYNFGTPVT